MLEREIEEILEALWTAEEEEEKVEAGSLASPHQEQPLLDSPLMQQALGEARAQGLVTGKEDTLELTEKGRGLAKVVVRRHRLAERLFQDVCDLESQEAESSACTFEHLLSPDATDSVCILLGHPSTCPHGKAIPPGECCHRDTAEVRPLVIPATLLREGEEATVAYLSTKAKSRLEKVATLGITPGSKIVLLQRRPAYLLQVDETQLALDEDIVKEIYVRHSARQGEKPEVSERRGFWGRWRRRGGRGR